MSASISCALVMKRAAAGCLIFGLMALAVAPAEAAFQIKTGSYVGVTGFDPDCTDS